MTVTTKILLEVYERFERMSPDERMLAGEEFASALCLKHALSRFELETGFYQRCSISAGPLTLMISASRGCCEDIPF